MRHRKVTTASEAGGGGPHQQDFVLERLQAAWDGVRGVPESLHNQTAVECLHGNWQDGNWRRQRHEHVSKARPGALRVSQPEL